MPCVQLENVYTQGFVGASLLLLATDCCCTCFTYWNAIAYASMFAIAISLN